ncbi:acyl transferase domain-containing protein/acyl carrier protein [Neorhizobium huautlense]|uniref:Acyl transferase domain-containing protein/acyl carrier protein n=1 Tax=Neorhizobium huautlense TaxID=67774 RepID=A0ABT9PMJ6_9HYPH|nr:type I polyketide synthase [Neorhizobium huautlense]MDP9835688.1 acyl transferase domain-containing protein/acyl carrier protein [Neorhizobium huautlense]
MSGQDAGQSSERIAIIGLAGRFPGAGDVNSFWAMLEKGHSGLSKPPEDRRQVVTACFALADKECFDAEFFGFAPSEAALMDPQQRVFLETAWHAMENAGYGGGSDRMTGVFAASGFGDYVLKHVGLRSYADSAAEHFAMLIGNDKDFLASRVAHHLDLKGPAVVVQSACSSGLLAVHQAIQSLLSGEIDMALAGAVSISMDLEDGYHADPGGPMSPTGRIAPFSAGSDGIVGGNGVAALVLKRLDDALRDGDAISAVIEGSAANNDGAERGNFTQPSVSGQKRVLHEALALSGLDPADIGYIEAHGTGTPIGDPIEMEAIRAVYGDAETPCLIGSVKANVGHLNATAGLAGLIKAIRVVQTGRVPATLNFGSANPLLELDGSRFAICDRLTDLSAADVHNAAVSSFGFGGTNVHVVLSSPPPRTAVAAKNTPALLAWSARNDDDLAVMEQALAGFWNEPTERSLLDDAGTLLTGRKTFSARHALVAGNHMEAAAKLSAGSVLRPKADGPSDVIFLFPGQGTQFAGMGKPFYDTLPTYREAIDQCSAIAQPLIGQDIRPLIFGDDSTALKPTLLTQLSLFATEYALARSLMAGGLKPVALLGHSIGEYVAACLAGVFSLEDALHLVCARAQLMTGLPEAAMLAVQASADTIRTHLHDGLSLAVVNRPDRCVISGTTDDIEKLAGELTGQNVSNRLLDVSHGFHSHLMDPILEAFAAACRNLRFFAPQIPVLSNVSGTIADPSAIANPDYWVRHLRQTVLFADDMQEIARTWPNALCVELGPGTSCTGAARAAGLSCLPTMVSSDSQTTDLLTALGTLWVEGHSVDTNLLMLGRPWRRAALPGYPFRRVPHLLPALDHKAGLSAVAPRVLSPEKWFHTPTWHSLPMSRSLGDGPDKTMLLFMPEEAEATEGFEGSIRIFPGHAYAQNTDGTYRLRPGNAGDFARLTDDVRARKIKQATCVFGWLLAPHTPATSYGHDSLVRLAQTLVPAGLIDHVVLVTKTLAPIIGAEQPDAEQALALGVLRAMPFEHDGIKASWLDADRLPSREEFGRIETLRAQDDSLHAISIGMRNGRFWQRHIDPVSVGSGLATDVLAPGGTYLVVGGNGNLGRHLVRQLRALNCDVITLGRSAPPTDATSDAESGTGGLTHVTGSAADRVLLEGMSRGLRAKGKTLDGIFNLAGRYVTQTLADRTLMETDGNRAAKVDTTAALAAIFASHQPEFLVAFSSLAGETSGYGNSDYMSANLHLDFLAAAGTSALPVISIGWDNWQADGAFHGIKQDGRALFTGEETEAIDLERGFAALWRIITSGLPHVIVTPRAIDQRLAEISEAAKARLARKPDAKNKVIAANDGSPLERFARLLFAQTLGMPEIAAADDFLQLGGDSILAVRLLSRLRRVFQIEFGLPDFLAARTPQQLARRLETFDGTEQTALAYLHIHTLPDTDRQALLRRSASA